MSDDNKIIQFPGQIAGVDELGIPNKVKSVVYAINHYYRGKLHGTILFLEKDVRDKSRDSMIKACEAAKQSHQHTFQTAEIPIY